MRAVLIGLLAAMLAATGIVIVISEERDDVGSPTPAPTRALRARRRSPSASVTATPIPTPILTPTPIPTPMPVPTPTPTPTPTLTSAPTPQRGEREAFAALVHAVFPDDPYMGDVVVWRETLDLPDWRDYVYGGRWSTTGDCGLMQINWYWHGRRFLARGWTELDCFDPAKNLAIAREIYDEGGPGMWTTYY